MIIPATELIYGDCMEKMPSQIPDKSVNLIICDLPYGRTKNEWDIPLDLKSLWVEYKRIIADNGVIILFADGMFMAELMQSNKKMWRYNLIWDKVLTTGFLNARRMPLRRHEEICVFYGKHATYNPQFTEGEPLHSKGIGYHYCFGITVNHFEQGYLESGGDFIEGFHHISDSCPSFKAKEGADDE